MFAGVNAKAQSYPLAVVVDSHDVYFLFVLLDFGLRKRTDYVSPERRIDYARQLDRIICLENALYSLN